MDFCPFFEPDLTDKRPVTTRDLSDGPQQDPIAVRDDASENAIELTGSSQACDALRQLARLLARQAAQSFVADLSNNKDLEDEHTEACPLEEEEGIDR